MAERLVDILDGNGRTIHTYPVELEGARGAVSDADYQHKALEAAAHGQLVPDAELPGLTAQMHQTRGGRLQPADDDISSSSETRLGLEQIVRERAYALWEQEGRLEGRAEEYWHRALEEHLRGRAYVLWEQEGNLEGNADGDWQQIREFESR